MNRKTTTLSVFAFLASISGAQVLADPPARYDDGDGYLDYARVLRVKPVYRHVRVSIPRRECWNEERRYRVPVQAGHSGSREVIGGLIGGALGSRLGKGKGRMVGAVTGAIIGSKLARDTDPNHHYAPRERVVREVERVCRRRVSTRDEERFDGYLVTYRYRGIVRTTRMSYRPGRRIRVRVRVEPVEE